MSRPQCALHYTLTWRQTFALEVWLKGAKEHGAKDSRFWAVMEKQVAYVENALNKNKRMTLSRVFAWLTPNTDKSSSGPLVGGLVLVIIGLLYVIIKSVRRHDRGECGSPRRTQGNSIYVPRKSRTECVVCMGALRPASVLWPCGHAGICQECAGKVKVCPLCRAEISSVGRLTWT